MAALLVAAVALAAAWASAGVEPMAAAVAGCRAPTDFTRDYVTAHAFVHGVHGLEHGAANDYAVSIGAPRVPLYGAPYHFHPPPALLVVLPLVPLGFRGAAVAWLVLSLAALAWLAWVLHSIARGERASPRWEAAAGFLLLALWPPVLHNLAKGQWSILLAALIAGGLHALERDREGAAGVWLGVAASLKAAPVLLLGYLILRRRRRAAAFMAGTVAALGLASLALEGPGAWRAFFAAGPLEVAAWRTWTANTASLGGVLARLLVGGPFARPLVHAPAVAAALTAGASLALLAAATFASRRAPAGPAEERRLFAAWCLLVVLLNPLGWTHTLVIALVALAAFPRPPVLAAVVLVVWSIPHETLVALAGPTPVGPLRGLFLGLHAAACLALLDPALATAREGASAPSSRSGQPRPASERRQRQRRARR
jgi:hypothetical protein